MNKILATIQAAYAHLPANMASRQATVMLLAIGLQESRFVHRWQIVNPKDRSVMGPARGFWQFERMGGVHGVLNHPRSKAHAIAACKAFNVDPSRVWYEMHKPENDVLCAIFARLLLWTDTRNLPLLGDAQGAWNTYIRNWRPGKPHRSTWDGLYAQALEAVTLK